MFISTQTHSALNALMHKLYVESYIFKGAACAFTTHGYPGYALFAKWEGHERWAHGSDVKKALYILGSAIVLPAMPAAKTEYATLLEAVTAMHGHDLEILEFISTGIKAVMKVAGAPPVAKEPSGEFFAVDCMKSAYAEMLGEYNEVGKVVKKTSRIKEPPGFASVDAWLSEYYSAKFKEKGY